MSQRSEATELIAKIASAAEGYGELLKSLSAIVGAAQNVPPLGEADGTLNERRWELARNVAERGDRFLRAVDAACEDF